MKINTRFYAFNLLFIFLFVSSVGAVIRIDGDTGDWLGVAGQRGTLTLNAGEAIWKDYENADIGDGDYEYPQADMEGWIAQDGMDIDEFRVTTDEDYMYFVIKTIGGLIFTNCGIFIDTNPGGSTTIGHNARVDLPPSLAWDVAVVLGDSGGPKGKRILMNVSYDGGISYLDTYEWPESDGAQGEAFFEQNEPIIEMRVPFESTPGAKDGIPHPANKSFKFIVLLGLSTPNLPANAISTFHDILLAGEEDAWQASGADVEGKAPNVFDLIGSTPEEQQFDFSLYDISNLTLLTRSFITVHFGINGLPETQNIDVYGKSSTTWGQIKRCQRISITD